jgi:neurofibromin 1
MSSNPKFSAMGDSPVALADVLDDMGFGGLWRSCSLAGTQEPDRQYLTLTEKLIEVSIPTFSPMSDDAC